MIEPKDKISLVAIAATFVVALINLVYTILNNRKTAFVNTVTASRLKWIDSLRDKVSVFISVTARILKPEMATRASEGVSDLLPRARYLDATNYPASQPERRGGSGDTQISRISGRIDGAGSIFAGYS
jgi:hypothetical protein